MLKPYYYDRFSCILGECSFTCCEGWKIVLDSDACRKHEKEGRPVPIGTRRCPFLNEEGLCDIVIKEGEESLPLTCHLFPRLICDYEAWTEAQLSFACPQVIDILRESIVNGEYTSFYTGYDSFFITDSCPEKEIIQLRTRNDEGYTVRKEMINILLNGNGSLARRMLEASAMLLDIEQAETKELLEELGKQASQKHGWCADTLAEQTVLLQDIVEEYRKQEKYADILKPIYKLLMKYSGRYRHSDWIEFCRMWENNENMLLFTGIYCSKIMDACLCDEREDCIIAYETLLLEYIAVRFSVFADWYGNGKSFPQYEKIRTYITVFSRIMGHNNDAMEEFIAQSYEEPVWQLDYTAVLLEENI